MPVFFLFAILGVILIYVPISYFVLGGGCAVLLSSSPAVNVFRGILRYVKRPTPYTSGEGFGWTRDFDDGFLSKTAAAHSKSRKKFI